MERCCDQTTKERGEPHEDASLKWALRRLASKYNREEIYREIWLEPVQPVAKRYHLSYGGLAKMCNKLNIPQPGRGYWATKAADKPWASARMVFRALKSAATCCFRPCATISGPWVAIC
jgi:hypothetical protein